MANVHRKEIVRCVGNWNFTSSLDLVFVKYIGPVEHFEVRGRHSWTGKAKSG